MSEICTCKDPNCPEAHDCEETPATYSFWFKGEYWGTLASEDTPAAVISEITGLAETPDEYGTWIVKDTVTGQRWTADKFFALHAA